MNVIKEAGYGWKVVPDWIPEFTCRLEGVHSMDWYGKRVIIIGAARQGLALARFLAERSAEVLITDRLPEQELEPAIQSLQDLPIEWVLGNHPLEILEGADLICPSGGVPLSLTVIEEAKRRGIPLSNDSQIFLETAPCPVIGITGSAGKTTTTTLVGRMANAAFELVSSGRGKDLHYLSGEEAVFSRSPHARAWIGGNIGTPLIASIDAIQPADLAILELSSFQLELMTLSPQVAAVLNITPNHLDRHGTMSAYWEAKARMVRFQTTNDITILGRDDPGAWQLNDEVRGRVVAFGIRSLPAGLEGTWLSPDGSVLKGRFAAPGGEEEVDLVPRHLVALRGEHNLENVLAACAIAAVAGLPVEAMRAGIQGFGGVPHRLEFVRTRQGVDWYNDSIATAPERAMAAIRSFEESLVLLAGGRDKHLPWNEFAALVRDRVDHIVLFGEAAGTIENALETAGASQVKVRRCQDLHSAVLVAAEIARPGDVVLLSPGGTSYDAFHDFEERGEAFRRWVMELPE